MTQEIGPFEALAEGGVLNVGLKQGETLDVNVTIGINIPRDTCDDFTELCMAVEPAEGASYSLAPGDDHIKCIPITDYINCIGMLPYCMELFITK